MKESMLVIIAYNCNHDHSKFSHLIPITVTFKDLDSSNLPNFSESVLLKIEKFITRKNL